MPVPSPADRHPNSCCCTPWPQLASGFVNSRDNLNGSRIAPPIEPNQVVCRTNRVPLRTYNPHKRMRKSFFPPRLSDQDFPRLDIKRCTCPAIVL